MPQPVKVSDSDVVRLIEDEMAGGISFDTDLTTSRKQRSDKQRGDREMALEYYDGVMTDLPAEEGYSSVVSRDVAEVIDTQLPGLMRVFAGTDRIVSYAPVQPGDEESAKQATDYVNHVWANELDGYRILLTWITDALQVRNGVVKAYWDRTPEYEVKILTGLTEDQLVQLDDEGVEFTGYAPSEQRVPDPATGALQVLPLHDVRIKRKVSEGRLMVRNVRPENFGLSGQATTIDDAACVWERFTKTRSELIKEGHPKDKVWELPASDGRRSDSIERNGDDGDDHAATGSGATDLIDLVEAHLRADCDGDGIAEERRVILAGGAGGRKILVNEAWDDDRPYVDLVAQLVPHRWMGKSAADNAMDLQRVKTQLWRGSLDNTYAQNEPRIEAVEKDIINPDELLNPTRRGVVRVKNPGATREIVPEFIAPNIMQMVQVVDTIIERRTGVSRATAALDSTALDPQTATGEQIEHDASYARTELVCRNMAELGFKPLFRKLLRIVVANQDRPRTIMLRDKWVSFDPRPWNAGMNVTVNLGSGTGSRERDLRMLAAVKASQEQIITRLGDDNPIVKPGMYVKTLHKIVEASGLNDADGFFAPVSDEEFATWRQAQPAPQDPKMQAVQAKIAGDRQALEADLVLDRERQAAETQNHRERLEADLTAQRERMAAELAMKQQELERDFALRSREMELEARLKLGAMAGGLHVGNPTNIPRTT